MRRFNCVVSSLRASVKQSQGACPLSLADDSKLTTSDAALSHVHIEWDANQYIERKGQSQ